MSSCGIRRYCGRGLLQVRRLSSSYCLFSSITVVIGLASLRKLRHPCFVDTYSSLQCNGAFRQYGAAPYGGAAPEVKERIYYVAYFYMMTSPTWVVSVEMRLRAARVGRRVDRRRGRVGGVDSVILRM